MIAVLVRQKVHPQHLDQYRELVLDHARRSATEELGCLRFDVVQKQGEPTEFYLYEIYQDQTAVDDHVKTPRFHRVVTAIHPWFSEPEQVTVCHTTLLTEESRAKG